MVEKVMEQSEESSSPALLDSKNSLGRFRVGGYAIGAQCASSSKSDTFKNRSSSGVQATSEELPEIATEHPLDEQDEERQDSTDGQDGANPLEERSSENRTEQSE